MDLPFLLSPEQRAARSTADKFTAEFESLREENGERIQRYHDWEAEYESCRETDVYLNVTDYGRKIRADERTRHDLKIPYAHPITQKHAYRVAGRMPDILCRRRDSSAPERYRADTIEKILSAVYGDSKAQLQLASGAHDASLLGAACFDVYYDVEDQMPYFRAVHPGSILVIPGIREPHEFKRVYRFWNVSVASFRAEYSDVEFPGGQTVQHVAPDGDTNAITMVLMSDQTHHRLMAGGVLIEEKVHSYGFAPYIVIPNLGPTHKVWGYSDYEFYRHVAAYYESALSRQADILRAVANGTLIDENSGQSPEDVKRAALEGSVIPVRKDGDIRPLEVPQIPAFADSHLGAIRTAINDLSGTPPAAWGDIGAASGSDRALQMMPQIELTALKQINWAAGLERLNAMLLQMIEQKQIAAATFTGTKTRKYSQTAFSITLNAASTEAVELLDENGNQMIDGVTGEIVTAPQNPKQLISGDYRTSVVFQQRLDRDDPNFVLGELNKFQQGAQSLYTTLTNLGVESPEDEMRLIEREAERFPWLRSGLIAMIKNQLDSQQGQGDVQGGLGATMADGGGASGALNFDALAQGLNGSSNGGGQSADSVPGAPFGGA